MFPLRIAVAALPQSLDPADVACEPADRGLIASTYQPLFRFDVEHEAITCDRLHPTLAESIEASPDWRRWTVHLRAEVRSPHGQALGAADVVWS